VNGRPLRWALVGPSAIAARRFLPALRSEDQEVVSVYSSSADRAVEFASAHGIALGTDDLDLALVGVDAAYVSSRNDRRADQVARVIAAGAHVFCEKPIALNLADAEALVIAAERARVIFAVNFHLRNGEALRAMRGAVLDGSIGETLSARAQHALRLPSGPDEWRFLGGGSGGGVILDLCSHTVDAMRFVLGREVIEVGATAVKHSGANQAEHTVATFQRFSGDVVASTYESFVTPFAGTVLEVHGTKASLLGRGLLTANEPTAEVSLRDDLGLRPFARGGPDHLYRLGVGAFVDAVSGTGQPVASGMDGLIALAVALAIREAVATRQSVRVEYPKQCNEVVRQ
jgi:1,5-anhydro-D-fructose reductase (1,5-anhydro-D-mannitol-forming)